MLNAFMTHYTQNYATIIGGSLLNTDFTDKERNHQRADSPLIQSQQNLVTL